MFSTEALNRQVKTVVAVVLCVGAGVFFLVYRSALPSDLLFTISIGSQVLLVVMGVLVALHEDWAKRHRWIVIGAFAAVGLVGFYTAVRDNRELTKERIQSEAKADAANAKLSDSMERLGTQTGEVKRDEGEIKRIAGLNTELQNKLLGQSGQLLDSSKRISDLSKQAIETTTGGESFCYMYMEMYTNPGPFPTFIHEGNEPLYNVHVRISDLHKEHAPTLAQFFKNEIIFTVGDLAPTSTKMEIDQIIPLSDSPHQDFNVFFDARNGYWDENLRMRKVGNNWLEAIRVTREVRHKHGKPTMKVLYEQTPKDFGPLDWNKP